MADNHGTRIELYLNRPLLPESLHSSDGILTDIEIKKALALGLLLTEADPGRAKYASYEMCIGPTVIEFVPDDSVAKKEQYEEKSRTLNQGDVLIILPGSTLKLFALERLNIPANVMAFALPVGNLYRLGLSPEVTFADPGFAGEFWIVVSNYSGRIVELKIGDPLARIQFFRLSGIPERIHQGANHVRQPPTLPRRVPRPDLTISEGDESQVAELLRTVTDKVDPPHFEHVFITKLTRAYGPRIRELNQNLMRLRRLMGGILCLVFAIMLWVFSPAWHWVWEELPQTFRDKLGSDLVEWIASGAFIALGAVALFFRKWLWLRVARPVGVFFGLVDVAGVNDSKWAGK